jgi:hypothetical protein
MKAGMEEEIMKAAVELEEEKKINVAKLKAKVYGL